MNEKIMKQEAQYDWLKDEVHCLNDEMNKLQQRIDKAIDFIVKHCVNEKASKELGMTCYTMADTNELEKIVNILKGSDKDDYR